MQELVLSYYTESYQDEGLQSSFGLEHLHGQSRHCFPMESIRSSRLGEEMGSTEPNMPQIRDHKHVCA